MKSLGGIFNANCPRPYFDEISQAETELKRRRLRGSVTISNTLSESLPRSPVSQRNAHVSNKKFTTSVLRVIPHNSIMPIHRRAKDRKTMDGSSSNRLPIR